jgi:hypothetical protein
MLTWLADEFRRAGLRVVECDGWKNRARSSGGYESGRPWCVMWHHTASATGGSAANDVAYMLSRSNPAYPTANVYIARNGEVWVMAAGATNTNGKGSAVRTTSKGTVPVDSMNSYAVGFEIGNNGRGEGYSQACIDAAFTASLVVTRKCGLLPSDVIHHQAYAPDRKVDPATATAVQGTWRPRSVTGSGTWSLDDLKAECTRRAGTGGGGAGPTPEPPTPVPPTPTPEEEDVVWRVGKRENGAYFIGDGKTAYWVSDTGDIDPTEALLRMAPGAVNVVRRSWNAATDATAGPAIVTTWSQVKSTMQDKSIKKYIGATKRF